MAFSVRTVNTRRGVTLRQAPVAGNRKLSLPREPCRREDDIKLQIALFIRNELHMILNVLIV